MKQWNKVWLVPVSPSFFKKIPQEPFSKPPCQSPDTCRPHPRFEVSQNMAWLLLMTTSSHTVPLVIHLGMLSWGSVAGHSSAACRIMISNWGPQMFLSSYQYPWFLKNRDLFKTLGHSLSSWVKSNSSLDLLATLNFDLLSQYFSSFPINISVSLTEYEK